MPNPTTLVEFAQQQVTELEATLATQKEELLLLQAEAALAANEHSEALKTHDQTRQMIALLRERIAAAAMSSDISELSDDLSDLVQQEHIEQAQVLEKGSALNEANRQLKLAASDLSATQELLRSALTLQDQYVAQQERLNALVAALAEPPLSEVGAAADGTLTTEFIDSRSRVHGDIPAPLRELAEVRLSAQQTNLKGIAPASNEQVASLLDTWRDEHSAVIDSRWRVYTKRRDRLEQYVRLSLARHAQALASLAAITQSLPLTEAQTSAITADDDTQLQNDRSDAATAAKTFEEKVAILVALQAERAQAVDRVLANDIELEPADLATAEDPATPGRTIGDIDNDIALATAERDSAEPSAGDIDTLNEWEAEVPDHIWQNLVRLNEAEAILTEVKDTDPSALTSELEAAELELVQALEARRKADKARAYLNRRLLETEGTLAYLTQTAAQRSFSAARGDR